MKHCPAELLPQVPIRFQSVEQYCDIFRGLLLEEIFATLVSALSSGGGGDGGGRGSGPQALATLRVTSFTEVGGEGFSHVTMVSDDWGRANGGGGSGGGGGQRWGSGQTAESNG